MCNSADSGSGSQDLLETGGVPLPPEAPPTLTHAPPREASEREGEYTLNIREAEPSVMTMSGDTASLPLVAFLFKVEDQGNRKTTYIWKVCFSMEFRGVITW